MSARPRPAIFPLREQAGVVTSRITVVFLALLGGVLGVATLGMALLDMLELVALPIGFVLGGLLGIIVGALLRRRSQPPPVEVTATALCAPRSLSSKRSTEVPLTDLRSIEVRGTRRAPLVLFGTAQGFIALPTRAFLDDEGPVALRDTVREAIAALPHGEQQLDTMARIERDGRAVVQRRPRATQVLLGLITGIFVFELSMGSPSDAQFMMRWGANAPALVEDGQWWRLFTAGLLHLSFIHFFLNATALLSLGGVVEKLLGSTRFVLVALGASVAGNAASMLTHRHVYSAGASSLVFGLIGALLVVNVRFGRALPAGFWLGRSRWLWLLGINGFVSMLPGVDGLAHGGGLAGGALLTLVLLPRLAPHESAPRPLHTALAAMLGAAFVIALGLTARHALLLDGEREGRDLALAALSTTGLPLERLYAIAVSVAEEPHADVALLDAAIRATERVLAAPDSFNREDVQATLNTLRARAR